MPGKQPSDQGRSWVRISTAMPRVAICHMTMVIRLPKVISGVRTPGLSLRQR
jgi:hypothetical protein